TEQTTPPPDLGFFNLTQCTPGGVAITGDVLVVPCAGTNTMVRLDKFTGVSLSVNNTLTASGLPPLNPDPGLGALACDPVTFQKDASGDTFTDALWSRRGPNGNGVVALEFPAFTCGLPAAPATVTNAAIGSGAGSVPIGTNPTALGFLQTGTAFLVTTMPSI